MQTSTQRGIRALRELLGQTQGEFAAMIGASKDTVASWETGRNRLSASLARRIAFVTGVDEAALLQTGELMVTVPVWGARPYTADDFARYRRTTKGRTDERGARHHLKHCEDALGLIFLAAARAGEGGRGERLPGVLDSFIRWCDEARRDFQLEGEIGGLLKERRFKFGVTLTYREWRELARGQEEALRRAGFQDDPGKGEEEELRLELEGVPGWAPGRSMRRDKPAIVEALVERGARMEDKRWKLGDGR